MTLTANDQTDRLTLSSSLFRDDFASAVPSRSDVHLGTVRLGQAIGRKTANEDGRD
ncbi:hypothetical protein BFJ67_g13578 [Fusarium oxysporum f. sp. cepae]|nr:hypothetical protein BFJ67_g13578 [Fusarium oxysporum f. sp. cepae]